MIEQRKTTAYLLIFMLLLGFSGCSQTPISDQPSKILTLKSGAEQPARYLPLLKGKKVGVITNHTGRLDSLHLIDFLISKQINVVTIFAPEHGFRGDYSDGVTIEDNLDPMTGIPIVSIYGSAKKPSSQQLKSIDVLVFDIQDLGIRFYTYISSLAYVMEAAAENNLPLIVLDRANPHANYVDGPVLDPSFSSFVGLHQVPVVYGMTIGEYAQMVKGEGWINKAENLNLEIITLQNYDRDSVYDLPVAPSPNLPNMQSVLLYPSLCFLEGAQVSIGRGTPLPFQQIGFPKNMKGNVSFTPQSIPGKSVSPPFLNELCRGDDLSTISFELNPSKRQINWSYVWKMYALRGPSNFYLNTNYFELLVGNQSLRKALDTGWTIQEFRESYQKELEAFKILRKKYLLYPDSAGL